MIGWLQVTCDELALNTTCDMLLLQRWMEHYWSATWQPSESVKHQADITVTQGIKLLGRLLPFTIVVAHITQLGPGVVHLRLNTPIGCM